MLSPSTRGWIFGHLFVGACITCGAVWDRCFLPSAAGGILPAALLGISMSNGHGFGCRTCHDLVLPGEPLPPRTACQERSACRFFACEIAAWDIQTKRTDIYGQDENYGQQALLLYDGLHYDAMSVAGTASSHFTRFQQHSHSSCPLDVAAHMPTGCMLTHMLIPRHLPCCA